MPSYRQGRRRRMDKFFLGEISAVDRPAQSPALSHIMKNDGASPGLDLMVDDGRFSDEEWEAVKSLGLPEPLQGEARGEYIARVSADAECRKDLGADALALVAHICFEANAASEFEGPMPGETLKAFADRAGVSEDAARDAFLKSHDQEALEKRGDLVDMMSGSMDQHQHGISIYEGHEGMHIMVHFAASEMGEMHDHQIIMQSDGSYVMSQNRGHNHSIDSDRLQQIILARLAKSTEDLTKDGGARQERARLARTGAAMEDGSFPIRNAIDLGFAMKGTAAVPEDARADLAQHIGKRATALGLTDQLPGKGDLADLLKTAKAGGGSVGKGVKTMPEDKQELDALKAKNDRLEAIVALPAVHKAHFDALKSDEDKDAFLKADEAERGEMVKAAETAKNDSDPVIYKSLDGEEFRQSDDPRLVRMAKSYDEREKENIKLRKKAEDDDLTKRAETDLKHFPGKVDVRKAILKAVDGISDDETREEAHKALKAKSASLAKGFQTVGTSEGPGVADDSDDVGKNEAETKLEELTKAYQTEHTVDYFTAYEKVSEANPDLLAKAIAG